MTTSRRVILAGGGHAHLAVLADWARDPLPDAECWLVTSAQHTAYSGMLPGWMVGYYRAHELLIDLKPLAEKAGAKLVLADVVGLNAHARTITLSTGEQVRYDLLSLATGGETDISCLAALGDRLLAAKPVDTFMEHWSALLDRASLRTPLHVAIVGGGAAGVELALAASAALGELSRHSRVTLVAPNDHFLKGHPAGVRRRVLVELEKRGVDLHLAQAAGEETGLLLSNGTFLPCDGVIAATGSRAPQWFARSGLELSSNGFVAVGADLRSTSHQTIFAAGDIIARTDRPVARSGVHAVKAGPILASNLRATLGGGALKQYIPRSRTLYLLATGDQRAILSWGPFSATGRLVWRLKDWIDQHFVSSYTAGATDGQQETGIGYA